MWGYPVVNIVTYMFFIVLLLCITPISQIIEVTILIRWILNLNKLKQTYNTIEKN